ncbi:MAG: type II toxin-antitoxin system VapB family antitoxin [Luteolibacter sp.]
MKYLGSLRRRHPALQRLDQHLPAVAIERRLGARRHNHLLLHDRFNFHVAEFRFLAYLESMKTTIDIPDAALADAMRFTGAKTKREAVVKALEAYNRQHRVNDLIASFGTLDFATNDEIEAGDLGEIALREAKGSTS